MRTLFLLGLLSVSAQGAERLNVLMITADDLNYDSLGVTGCKVDGITPNLDRLAKEGMLFERAHVNIAVCQPCRSVIMTGRYPHNNGALGFQPIKRTVPTLGESLRKAGYFNGILAKVPHLSPVPKFCWDKIVQAFQLGIGRDAQLYYKHTKAFLAEAKKAGKPFFLMANSQDPHRPFAKSQQEKRRRNAKWPEPSRIYKPKEVSVPGFLPDLPPVRREIAQYYTSVHRCDDIVGSVLKALKESGQEKNTLVLFLGDHGMALPFAKTNCYLHSTRTPLIVRWPGTVKAGSVDKEHFVSTIDFMPTLLEALGLPRVPKMDGSSFLPLLKGQKQKSRESVYTVFHRTSGRRDYEMRSVIRGRYGYIYNAWANGRTLFRNESQNGLTMRAMHAASRTNQKIAERVQLFLYRVTEELYDYEKDPDARHNLVRDPDVQPTLRALRKQMLEEMVKLNDPLEKTFRNHLSSKTKK